jgi:hypothetical protein
MGTCRGIGADAGGRPLRGHKNGQGVPVTHETHPGDIYPFNDNNIFSSFAMRDVAKQERRAHGYALSGDCAMLKLPSL